MSRHRLLAAVLLGAALVTGTIADRPRPPLNVELGGYRVLASDFHVHSSLWSNGALTPWGLVFEARRQGLDAIAITGHNEVLDGKVARWTATHTGGVTVVAGHEILTATHHIVAIGVEDRVDSRQPAADQIDEIHRQGGVAIAAHPLRVFWPGYDARTLAALDGAEVCHPTIFVRPVYQTDLERFLEKAPLAAIGSSDFHRSGRVGMCRTYVFARDNTAEAIVEAVRARRTVVYGLYGKAYGDPSLVALAETRPELRAAAAPDVPASWLDWISRVTGVMGLAGIVLLGTRSTVVRDTSPPPAASKTP